ncbi:ArnT family glycosyltransferase [Leptothoe spongobia]|uniref:Glycosyltransferase family 39 protein n=1 Tax=Leptothoe spongobia TAU-MAC 1115 TaxID=1967444 RepID=A0A947GHN9_9CYAN|nr:glycosyltransferase family 39 protein [Leptothoe spongobia]MBT9314848.1 glycosyltransferase family 39 protein [Leptothoe spongobia TAU-MAC 1115]
MPPVTRPVRLDRFIYILLGVVLIVLLYNLHLWVITTGTEGAIADISRDMLVRQNFMHPRLLGVNDFSQLPIPLWLTSLGMKLWGVNTFGARFFVQVSIVIQVIFTYRIAMRLFGSPQIGLFAGLIYLSCPLVLVCSRYLSADVFLTTFELAAIYCILLYHLEKLPVALYGLAVSVAGGFLCGGVRSLVLPLLVGAYVLMFGPRNYWIHWRHGLVALIMGLGLIGFWFVHMNDHLPDFWAFTRQTFWQETFFGIPRHPRWQYIVGFLTGSLPWWIIVIPNMTAAPLWQNPNVLPVAVCWLLLPLGFYTLTGSASLAGLLPLLAGFSILVSYLVHLLSKQYVWLYSRWFAQIYGTLGLLALMIPLSYQMLGQPLKATWPMVITAVGTLVLVILLYRSIRAGVRFRLIAMVLVPSLMMLLYGGYYVDANGPWKESTDVVSRMIQQRRLEGLPVLVYNETLPSLAFGLNKDTITINDGVVNETFFQTAQDWETHWIRLGSPSANRYLRRLMTAPSVLVIPGDLPARWNWVKINYPKIEWAGRWQVLYRPQ